MRLGAVPLLLVLVPAACGGGSAGKPKDPLRINEVMTNDEGGTAIDEVGQIGDWIELCNTGATAVDLSVYTLSDGQHPDMPLPGLLLDPLVWLVLLPFRLLGGAVDGVLGLLRAVLTLPARVLGGPRAMRG